jgi:hypothetical protein
MLDQETCARPVIVTLPAQISTATAEQAAEQISAAFTPGVSVVIADLTCTACRDRSAIRHLLKAHRKATARGRQVRFAIRPGGSLHRITEFADTARGLPHPPARHNRQITQASPAIAAAIMSSPSMTGPTG